MICGGADVARVALDLIPEAARPAEVATVLAEAVELRDRHRAANEQLAAAQAELERQEEADVADAAKAIRSGEEPGKLSAGIVKQRHAVEVAQRNAAALALALQAAEADLAGTMRQHADTWIAQLDAEAVQAQERAVAALAAFEDAVQEMGLAAGASEWVRAGLSDDRWDRRVPTMAVGGVARSSQRRTANGEALRVNELIGFLHEAVQPPAAAPEPILGSAAEASV
jgi:hypothetical protein